LKYQSTIQQKQLKGENHGLTRKTRRVQRRYGKKAPQEALDIMHRATEDLRNSAITEEVVKVGDPAPEFELQNAAGKPIRLKDFLSEGPLVLSFYRIKS
jgi:hypothetical protein